MRPFLLAVLFLGVFCFQPARSQDSTRPAVGGVSSPANAMIFYLAHGPSGACGPNCSEWIAAEGTVQWDTYKRLLALLDRLGDRTPVVVLTSGRREISRLRRRSVGLSASVGLM